MGYLQLLIGSEILVMGYLQLLIGSEILVMGYLQLLIGSEILVKILPWKSSYEHSFDNFCIDLKFTRS
jgi:hypothetical protein